MSGRPQARLPVWLLPVTACLVLSPAAQGAVIGQWTFNEGTGTNAFDSSAIGNTGFISESTDVVGGTPPEHVPSPGSFAVSLDGVNDFVDWGTNLFNFSTEAFSVETWVAIGETQTGNNHGIFGFPISTNVGSWRVGYEHDGGAMAKHNVGLCGTGGCPGIARESASGSATPFGTYRHVGFTKSTDSELKLFVDGVVVAAGGGYMQLYAPVSGSLQAGSGNGNHLECLIDEIRVHDVYLSDQQIMNSFLEGPTVDPVPPPVISVEVENTFAITFPSEAGVRYELESTTETATPSNFVGTGLLVTGTGTNMFLFDPGGYSTAKLYRVSIKL